MGYDDRDVRHVQRRGEPFGSTRRHGSRHAKTSFTSQLVSACLIVAAITFALTPGIRSSWSLATQPKQKVEAVEHSVYYRNCAAARAAGAAPIYRGSPGYREGMDGDGDGVACEPYY